MHGAGRHFVSDESGGHEQRNEDADQKHNTQFSDGQHKASVDGFQCVRLVVRIFVDVAVALNGERALAVAVSPNLDVTRHPVPVGVFLRFRSAVCIAVAVVVNADAALFECIPVKIVFVDPIARVIGCDGWVEQTGVVHRIEHIGAVHLLLSVGVAVVVPVVGIAVVVHGFIITRHRVHVEHRQDAHGRNPDQQNHPC